jgi:GTPase SAR1 family protein
MKKNDFKIAIIGNKNSGKFSLTRRITTNKFSKKNIKFSESKENQILNYDSVDETIKLNFICIDEYSNYSKLYYNAIIISIDLTSLDSFRSIPSWIECVKNNSNLDFIILVGTKCDEELILIDNQKIINLCKNYENNNIKYIETSSKTGKNINELVDLVVNSIFLHKTNNIMLNPKDNSSFDAICETYETTDLLPKRKKSKIIKFISKFFPCFE